MDVPTRFFGDTTSSSYILIVGGSGDSKDSYDELIHRLIPLVPQQAIVTFSFRGVEEKIDMPLSQQIQDLKDVIGGLKNRESVSIVATSNGAFSVAHLLGDPEWGKVIRSVVLLDPADHYGDTQETVRSSRTWTGTDIYAPTRKTTSILMGEITSDVVVHVVNFTLRNYGKDGYTDEEVRGIDDPARFARLNNDMVASFYSNMPEKNKGNYIEDNTIPHAFMRDGDVEKNMTTILSLLKRTVLA
ncbi:MAG: hypothetical protein WAV30_00785 [Microgenomates group bacterium]